MMHLVLEAPAYKVCDGLWTGSKVPVPLSMSTALM